jgi:lysine 2,3-aminomutase
MEGARLTHDESLKPPQSTQSISRKQQENYDDWLVQMKHCVKDVEALSRQVNLSPLQKEELKKVADTYHMSITPYYLSLCNLNDPNDPIRKQCVPDEKELVKADHEMEDPLSEVNDSPVRCLVHRYPDRVLLITTNRCAMYCRHCTRKRIWKKNVPEPSLKEIKEAVQYITAHKEVREVIISGGDPLLLSTGYLNKILAMVSSVPHVQAMRIGTRVPVVLPQRIDDELCAMLEQYEKLWINTQFNHPNEITPESTRACRKLQKCGIPLNNQSVLLKGINDNPETYKLLCQKLQAIRVRPYYLFQCDAVVGAEHFRTPIWAGVEIIEKLRGHTGGLCVPTFVIDGEGGKGKIPVQPQYLISATRDSVLLRNFRHEVFEYHNPDEK